MRLALLAAALGLLAGCQDPDVGQACTLSVVIDAPTSDWFETGNTACDNLVCMQSPMPLGGSKVKNNPYCSKACISDRDCYSSETGLVCRAVVLDQEFLAALDPATRARYLGDIQISNYCAIPLP